MATDTNNVRRAVRHLVVPDNIDNLHIEPKEGFTVGDQIVVAGQNGLKENSPIRELSEEVEIELPSMMKDKPKKPKGAAIKAGKPGKKLK